jgi:chitinase
MQRPGTSLRVRKQRTCFGSIKALLYFNVLFLLSLFVGSAVAADVELAWDANTESDLAGYYLYYKTGSSGAPYNGTEANEGDSPIQVPLGDLSDQENPSYTITGLSDTETYFFVVTAYNTDGHESGYSNEVSYQPPSTSPLSTLSISGDYSVNENSSANYTATATFSDGSTRTVTGSADWSIESFSASIDSSGVLTTSEVSSDQTATIQASYTYDTVTETATKVVTIVDVPALNLPPSTPIIDYPYDEQVECEVPMSVTTEPFSDPDGDSHKQSRWQISEQSDFSTLTLDVTTNRHLTVLTVPHTVLKPNQSYHVRVQFYDMYSEASNWSDSVEFTTGFIFDDLDSDGIPDVWEVDDTVDFNLDGIPDNYQPETIKCILAAAGSAYIGVEKISDSISEIQALEVIDPATISDTSNRPDDLVFGLVSYRLRVNQPGATALVRIYFSGEISAPDTFFKYDTISGWYEYSEHTTFNDDGQSVTLELKDGGYGDSDGVANGVIVDPGGIASGSTYTPGPAISVEAGGGEGCVIATAAHGSPMENHVSVLKDFRDTYLVHCALGRIFVKTYNKYSPPLAHFIAKHEILKAAVRFGLYPLVAFSYTALHFGITVTACGVLLILVLPVFLISVCRRGLISRSFSEKQALYTLRMVYTKDDTLYV